MPLRFIGSANILGILRLRARLRSHFAQDDRLIELSQVTQGILVYGIPAWLSPHRYLHALLLSKVRSFVIPRIHVPGHTDSRIIGKNALDALGHCVRSVGHGDLAGMERVANPYAAAVVDRDPACPAAGLEHRVQQWPVRDGITAGFHALGFT